MAWLIIVSVSDFHHSPAIGGKAHEFFFLKIFFLIFYYVINLELRTKNDWNFFEGLGEWVGRMSFWKYDNWSIYSCSKPWDVGMPKQSPSLPSNGEVVHIDLACLNRALCDVSRSICPSASELPDSMPAPESIRFQIHATNKYKQQSKEWHRLIYIYIYTNGGWYCSGHD